jgi:succinyl-CoA synthetase beta subunit
VDLHEYQAKERFGLFGIPVPKGKIAHTPTEAAQIAQELGGTVVVKAQVHTGGRGKAGGVKLAKSPQEAQEMAQKIIGMKIKHLTVHKVLIDPAADIKDEIYFAITNDRAARKPVFIVSAEGGMDIEEVNRVSPEKLFYFHVDPLLGLRDYQVVQMASSLNLPRELWRSFSQIAHGLYRCYVQSGATLCEINPLAVVGDGKGGIELKALDGKMSIDNNALINFPELESLRDTSNEPEEETQARQAELNYVKLDGQIGCMVNGAGLAMATMDMVSHFGEPYGIAPANFLDVAGGAGSDKVAAAMRIILRDSKVKAILINIFGGITRCDDVARGILAAMETVKTDLPIVVRLSGTNQEEALAIIKEANLPNIHGAASFYEAAQKVVAIAQGA